PAGPLSAVWAGDRMFVWDASSQMATYDPKSDTWAPVSRETGVEVRPTSGHLSGPSLVWTGCEVIVWGGAIGVRPTRYLRNGSRYDPATDTWAPIPDGGPEATDSHKAVWTGTEMLIWPGGGSEGIGGAYRPYWLAVRSPTQAYGVDDSPLFVAQPGELYRVIQFQDDWALVQADGDPPSSRNGWPSTTESSFRPHFRRTPLTTCDREVRSCSSARLLLPA